MSAGPRLDGGAERRVRESFARQSAMTTIGAELVRLEPGLAVVELVPPAGLTQQHGYLHAGVVTMAVDTACGYAAYTLMPADADVLTVEFKVNLLAPAVGDRFLCRARVLRAGRTLTVCRGDVVVPSAEGERPIATMLATLMRITRRDGPTGPAAGTGD